MQQIRRSLTKMRKHPGPGWLAQLVVPLALGAGLLVIPEITQAANSTAPSTRIQFPLGQVFTFLFLMLGPFKIIAPFSEITRGADAGVTRRIAIQATLFASVALLIAAVLGDRILSSYNIPLPVLALSAGVILFLVALQNTLQQFTPPGDSRASSVPAPSVQSAMTPLAFPTIVTPYGIAALVVFLSFSADLQMQLTIGAMVLAVMLLNLVVMLTVQKMLPVLSVLLPILGAVIGVVQVALGLQIINNSLKAMGIL
jgi:multiple antibiotic resistance protein